MQHHEEEVMQLKVHYLTQEDIPILITQELL